LARSPTVAGYPGVSPGAGETLFLKGPSGSGKTTLLGLLGGVQKPNRGSIRLLGQELTELSAGARDHFRVDHTGYIFQQFNLLPFLSVRENVELPAASPSCAPDGRSSAMAASTRPPPRCLRTWG
jgi:putative ABC transport system ATP-binding protein